MFRPAATRTIHGYMLIQRVRRGPVEVWHARSDELKHIAPRWIDACRWAEETRCLPASSKEWPPPGYLFAHERSPG